MPSQSDIKAYLIGRDKALKPIIDGCSYPRSRKSEDIYLALLQSIVSQQLSVKAADTIFQRFVSGFSGGYPNPSEVAKLNLARLRKAGLSRQKAAYIREVALFSMANGGMTSSSFRRIPDEDVIVQLTQIKGVGRWTVEMILMFALDRKDVFSPGDLGVQKAMRRIYDLSENGRELKFVMESIADRWRPYRSIVCKYFWQWNSL